jgi:hypothetical protein
VPRDPWWHGPRRVFLDADVAGPEQHRFTSSIAYDVDADGTFEILKDVPPGGYT